MPFNFQNGLDKAAAIARLKSVDALLFILIDTPAQRVTNDLTSKSEM